MDNIPSPEDENQDSAFNKTMSKMSAEDGLTGIKFEFPFDLNKLFDLQYSFDTLKQAIEYLAR